jgi:hypothetical protein
MIVVYIGSLVVEGLWMITKDLPKNLRIQCLVIGALLLYYGCIIIKAAVNAWRKRDK